MRRALLVLCLAACRSSQSVETQPQPQPLPQQATATATVAVTAPPTSSVRPVPADVCEPTIACGHWSKCRWLEFDHAEPAYDVYRVVGSDAGGYGSHYWRMHQCWPEDAGPKGCARYCDAGGGACVDGLTADGVCTVSGPPTPSPYACEVHGRECVTLPAKSP